MEQRKKGDFTVELLKSNQPVSLPQGTVQVLPKRMLILPKGDINDEPSLAILCDIHGVNTKIVMQISQGMFNEGLGDLGKLSLNIDPLN